LTVDTIVILDYGSQYSRLIARRVRECRVYSEILPYDVPASELERLKPRGIILSGGPASVYEPGAPGLPAQVLELGVPILGICYGMQLLAHALGGAVEPGDRREYGPAVLEVEDPAVPLLKGLPRQFRVWMSHGDRVTVLPAGFRAVARSENSPVAVMAGPGGRYGVQFHPEVVHTEFGREIICNFVVKVCGCAQTWTPGNFIAETISRLRTEIGGGRVLGALSGGVDSTVACELVYRAVGPQLTCMLVDTGLMRAGEVEETLAVFRRHLELDVRHVDASAEFFAALAGVTDPEEKRRRVGETFIRVFERESAWAGPFDFLVQGTLYPDVIESAADARAAARIKTHHNVGGLPERLPFRLVEPLRYLFKDEVREIGLALGLPESVVYRQPFPGPGLAVRIIGEVTPERVEIVRAADRIVREEISRAGLERDLWQWFAVLTPVRTVGVMGDYRTYGYVLAVRAVTSEDAMTADWARLPHDVLARLSNRIVNEVSEVTRVVYDITSKPPATIEWE
jgi:GMP synthase (glutamine-hydrolysing)